MSGRRGRPSKNGNNQGHSMHPVIHRRPDLQLKRINTETMSIHELSDEAESIVDSNRIQTIARQKPGPKPRTLNANADINQLLLSIKSDTAATRNEIRSTRTELKSDIHQLSSHTEAKFNSIDKQMAKTTSDLKSLFTRMSNIESGAPSPSINNELQKQLQLRNNISISGMPFDQKENVVDIVDWILDGLGLPELKAGELINARRISNSKSQLIIVSFRDFELKNAVMQLKAKKRISLSDIYELRPNEANPHIYINNHLTPFYSNLSYHGRNAISNKLIHSCWVSSRGFLVKLDEDSKPSVIDSVQHLENFLKENGRVAQRKRDRSSEMDPSPSTSRASKMKATRRIDTQVDIGQLDAAAKAMNISQETTPIAPSSNQSGGDDGNDLEHNRID